MILIIMDKQGNLIEVVDLELAIMQVKAYMADMKEDPAESRGKAYQDKEAYWSDMYNKLMHLREKNRNHGED